MALLESIFYATGLIGILYEYITLNHASKVKMFRLENSSNDHDRETYKGLKKLFKNNVFSKEDCEMMIGLNLVYTGWTLLGLLSSLWPGFILLLLWGFLMGNSMKETIIKLNAAVSLVTVLGIIIYAFHFQ